VHDAELAAAWAASPVTPDFFTTARDVAIYAPLPLLDGGRAG